MFSVTRLFRLGIRFAAWATPHVKEWHRQRNLNVAEAERHISSRNWSEAENYLCLALNESRHSAKRRMELMLQLAETRRRQAKLDQAAETAQATGELAAQSHDQAMRSRALAALADVQLDQKKFAEAEQTIREVEAIENSRGGSDRALLAQCSQKLGTALLQTGRNEEAFAAFQQAATLSEQAFGPNHEQTARSLSQLGALHRQHGDHEEAQRSLRRALEIHRTASGAHSNESTEALYHLAASLEEAGDIQAATEEYERMLRLKERQVGGNRDETTAVQVRLAALSVTAGRIGAARELLTQAIGLLERKGGPLFAEALEVFADVEDHMGHPTEAKQWRERAAEIYAAKSS